MLTVFPMPVLVQWIGGGIKGAGATTTGGGVAAICVPACINAALTWALLAALGCLKRRTKGSRTALTARDLGVMLLNASVR